MYRDRGQGRREKREERREKERKTPKRKHQEKHIWARHMESSTRSSHYSYVGVRSWEEREKREKSRAHVVVERKEIAQKR
jgi:hypothetical protein